MVMAVRAETLAHPVMAGTEAVAEATAATVAIPEVREWADPQV